MSDQEWLQRWSDRAEETEEIETPDTKVMVGGDR